MRILSEGHVTRILNRFGCKIISSNEGLARKKKVMNADGLWYPTLGYIWVRKSSSSWYYQVNRPAAYRRGIFLHEMVHMVDDYFNLLEDVHTNERCIKEFIAEEVALSINRRFKQQGITLMNQAVYDHLNDNWRKWMEQIEEKYPQHWQAILDYCKRVEEFLYDLIVSDDNSSFVESKRWISFRHEQLDRIQQPTSRFVRTSYGAGRV